MTHSIAPDHNDANRILRLLNVPFRVVFDPSRNLEGLDYWVTQDDRPISTHPDLTEALGAIGCGLRVAQSEEIR